MTARDSIPAAAPGTGEDLVGQSVERVLKSLEAPAPDPRALYYRWEREQWEAGALDLEPDHALWRGLGDPTRLSVLAALSFFLVPDGRLTEVLVPFVDAVPTEEEQVFLTSQLVDEARAVVFCERLLDEMVTPEPGSSSRAETALRNGRVGALLDLASSRADEVRVARAEGRPLYEGLLLLGVLHKGVIAPPVQRRLVPWLQDAGLPGTAAGVTALARDGTRHALFAMRSLQQVFARSQGGRKAATSASDLEALIEEALPVLQGVVDEGAAQSNDFDGLPFGDEELTTETMECLARRMQDIGIDLPT